MEQVIQNILNTAKRIAVVGLSPKKDRPSYRVAEYLMAHGYEIVPVNPNCAEVLDRKCYQNLADVPGDIDVVDIFRKPEDIIPIVEAAIKIKARAIWMQEGIVNQEAAKKAREAGIEVVMDRCMLKEHAKIKAEG